MSGIQPHSTPVKSGEWYVFSSRLFTPDYVDEELDRLHVPYKRLQGRFDGVDEPSWIIHSSDWHFWKPVFRVLTEQEHAVMILGERDSTACMCRTAFVETLEENPRRSSAGWLREVTRKAALNADAYTYDPTDHRYWIIVQDKPLPVKPKVPRNSQLFWNSIDPVTGNVTKLRA